MHIHLHLNNIMPEWLYDIQCNEPRILYVTSSSAPVCLYQETYEVLLNRGVDLLRPTPESFVRGVIEDTIALYDSDPDTAFDTITAMMSTSPSYPFVIDSNTIVVAHGADPDVIGTKGILAASTDKMIDALVSDLEENGEMWVEYTITNPSVGIDQYKRSLIVLHDGYIFGSGYYQSLDIVVRDVIEDVIALYDSDPDTAFDTITAMMSTHPSYPFVIDSNAIIVAHGANPDFVGKYVRPLVQFDGSVDDFLSGFNADRTMWLEYTSTHPLTGTEQQKHSLLIMQEGYIFGSGYYIMPAMINETDSSIMPLLELTEEENMWLEENNTIRVAFGPQRPTTEYVDEEGNLDGIILRYVDEISRLTGADFVSLPEPASWNDALSMIPNDMADIMFVVVNTPDRLEYMNFTTPHYTLESRLVTLDDRQLTLNDDNLVLVVIDGYAIEVWLDQNHPDVKYESVASYADGFELMKTDARYVFAEPWPVITYHALNAKIDVYNAGPTGYMYDLSVGYGKDNLILGSIMQKVVDVIPASLVEQWWNDGLQ